MHPQPARPLTETIDAMALNYLRARGRSVTTSQGAPTAVYQELRRRQAGDTIIISTDFDSFDRMAALDRESGRFRAMGLEAINPRLASVPFYIVAQGDTVGALASLRSARIGYVAQAHDLAPTDVQDILRPLLALPSIEAVRIDSPALMATRLLAEDASRIHFAGIYDEEPSVFLHRFVAAYNAQKPKGEAGRLKSARLVLLPTAQAGLEPNVLRASAGGALDYVIVRYDEAKFYDYEDLAAPQASGGMITLARRDQPAAGRGDFPVFVTNLRRTGGEAGVAALVRALGDIYLAALFENQAYGNRCGGRSAPIYKTYLLNAHLSDRTDSLKGLGLWGHLLLMRTVAESQKSRYEAEARILEDLLERQMNVPAADPDRLLAWLARSAPRLDVREQFSSDASSLYRHAVVEIRQALEGPPADRKARLDRARGLLLTALRGGAQPKCAQGGRGLWSANDYDPYFHLALIESYLRLSRPLAP